MLNFILTNSHSHNIALYNTVHTPLWAALLCVVPYYGVGDCVGLLLAANGGKSFSNITIVQQNHAQADIHNSTPNITQWGR